MELINLTLQKFLINLIMQTSDKLMLISGPCVVESKELTLEIADQLVYFCKNKDIDLVFKASYRKANRSSSKSFTGIGDIKALEILAEIGSRYQIPTTTDIHSDAEAGIAAEYVDILQIPAFLCRQSSLLEAAGRTGKTVNIKKGQFMSPEAMIYALEKVRAVGGTSVWLTERGTSFGYEDLIVDFRAIPIMQSFGVPVIVDCTHSLQVPNQTAGVTGGKPEFIEHIARAAVAVGADGVFIETHPNPKEAKSDGANMLRLELMTDLLEKIIKLRQAIRSF